MKTLLWLMIFMTALLPDNQAWGQLRFEDGGFPEFATSARALAMGNAYINKVDDSWAAFYNPAGLGTVRGEHFHVTNIHLESNSGFFDVNTGGSVMSGFSNFGKSFDAQKLREVLVDQRGKMVHSRMNLFPNMTFRYLSIGFLYTQRNQAVIGEGEDAPYELAERRDMGPVAALNLSLFGGVIKLGASAVWLQRKELLASFGPTEQVVIRDEDYNKGRAFVVTGGARLTLPVAYLPTFSLVMRNMGDNDFDNDLAIDRPTRVEKTMDLAFSLSPQIGKTSRVHFEINYRDINNAYEVDAKRRIGLGMEVDFARRAFFRLGSGDGYGSFGVGLRNRTTIIDISTYAVDTTSQFRGKEDRRFVFSLARGF